MMNKKIIQHFLKYRQIVVNDMLKQNSSLFKYLIIKFNLNIYVSLTRLNNLHLKQLLNCKFFKYYKMLTNI